jgi:hypothetical protein
MDLHQLPGASIGCRTSQSAIVSHRMGDYAFTPTIFPVNGFSSIPRYPTHPQLTDNRMLKQEREIFAVELVILSNTVALSSSTCLPAQVHKSRNWSPLSSILQSDNEAATHATL